MTKKNTASDQVQDETAELKNRLEETEETLHAIRQYLVDAFVINRLDGTQVVTLSNAEFPYRMMVESMNEGAVTLIPDGTIFYCNPRFGEMVEIEPQDLIGVRFRDLIWSEEQRDFSTFLEEHASKGARGQFSIKTVSGKRVPVQLSIFELTGGVNAIAILAGDMTERIQSEEKIRALTSELTMAEQEERHRISQILHDDLQQRLFAIKAQLSLLREMGGKAEDEATLRADFDQIQDWLSEAISMTRNLSIDLSPASLHEEGLKEAIARLAAQMKTQYNFDVEIEAQDYSDSFDYQTRLLLFQAVRELLFNVVKHAGTSQAVVSLEQDEQYLRIHVRDSGNGFDAETVMNDPNLAHGLLFIQNRLSWIGCTMRVTSKPGAGTTVAIETPLGSHP